MNMPFPVWRSLLFVPAHIEKFVNNAHRRCADACILDLEDSVPAMQKSAARQLAGAASELIAAQGPDVLVRINPLEENGRADLQAVVGVAVRAVVVPKVSAAVDVQSVAQELEQLERSRNLPLGHTLILAQIEDVRALPALDEIAVASPRLMGMSLGSEDFSLSAGMEPVLETLFWPNQQVAFACRRAGILPFGFPGSIADFSDLPRFRQTVLLARQLGMVGALCIHPGQVGVLNEVLSPSSQDVEYAKGVLAEQARAEAEGRGAFAYQGKMIDPPVVARAHELLARYHAAKPHARPARDQ